MLKLASCSDISLFAELLLSRVPEGELVQPDLFLQRLHSMVEISLAI